MTPHYPDLNDSVTFITGGGAGIGAAFVQAFHAQGAKVAFVSLPDEAIEAPVEALMQGEERPPLYIPCDVRDVEALQAAIRKTETELGPIDTLINNAARDDRFDLQDYSVDDWNNSLNTNLRPHFFTVQAVLPSMQARGRGSIINMGSNAANLGLAGFAAYVTAKSGIAGLTKALAREVGVSNVRVNAIVPGWVMTERQKKLWASEEKIESCLNDQSIKRLTSVEDIANGALFLASSAAAMITGQSLVIDGGRI